MTFGAPGPSGFESPSVLSHAILFVHDLESRIHTRWRWTAFHVQPLKLNLDRVRCPLNDAYFYFLVLPACLPRPFEVPPFHIEKYLHSYGTVMAVHIWNKCRSLALTLQYLSVLARILGKLRFSVPFHIQTSRCSPIVRHVYRFNSLCSQPSSERRKNC